MNGSYALEHIAGAAVAANRDYFRQHPGGPGPDLVFYMDFLEPYVEREMRLAKLDEIHLQTEGPVRKRELELVDSLKHWNRLCEQRDKEAKK